LDDGDDDDYEDDADDEGEDAAADVDDEDEGENEDDDDDDDDDDDAEVLITREPPKSSALFVRERRGVRLSGLEGPKARAESQSNFEP
jgi:hypothetical protein